jgi:hypothetical protein
MPDCLICNTDMTVHISLQASLPVALSPSHSEIISGPGKHLMHNFWCFSFNLKCTFGRNKSRDKLFSSAHVCDIVAKHLSFPPCFCHTARFIEKC